MKRDIQRTVTYPHPPERVWQALTDPKAIAQWLMPNDFKAEVGHRFQFRTDPAPGFDGIVDCEVLEVSAPNRLSYTWKGGPIDTVVTFELSARDGGTELRFSQTGFRGLRGIMVSFILGSGAKKIYGTYLPAVLDKMAAGSFDPAESPSFEDCKKAS